MKKNDGSPAYPITPIVIGDRLFDENASSGMSLRDAFAIAALPGMMNGLKEIPIEKLLDRMQAAGSPHSDNYIAHRCYAIADAMLAERDE